MHTQRWYHWLVFTIVVLVAATIGVLNLFTGASADSPLFNVDDVLVRVLGAAFIASAVLMILRRKMGYVLAALCFLLSGLEVVVTWLLGQPIAGTAVVIVLAISVLLAGAAMWAARTCVQAAAGA